MGLIAKLFGFVFGDGNKAVKETIEIFRENAEAGAEREHALTTGALAQFAAEFAHSHSSRFDRVIDGLNRVPRPALAFGTLGLFISAMADPAWFAARMEGMALVPEPLWWLLGAIVSFYFGARHQSKSQDFQKSITKTVAMAKAARPPAPVALEPAEEVASESNPALAEWKAQS
ncbi:MAG: holin family protein [Pseudomonadota bacterium]